MAGVFEGEGSVRINVPTKRNRGHLVVDMVNTDADLVKPFAKRWGGYYRFIPAVEQRRGFYRWRCAARVGAKCLADLQPFIRSRRVRRKVALALEFQGQKSVTGRNKLAGYIARQNNYYEQMKQLNRRGN
jgi:hypothetical protein